MKTNELLNRYKLRDNQFCDECPDQIESREHVLLECPAYESKRFELQNQLNYSNLCLNLNIILGDFSSIREKSKQIQSKILKYTGQFIEYITIARKLNL